MSNLISDSAVLPSASSSVATNAAYIKCDLAPGCSAFLPMPYVQEVMTLPADHLSPIPNMAIGILGLMNRRSRVLWVLDLAQVLGMTHLNANRSHYPVAIVRVGAIALGFAVHHIGSITTLSADAIGPVPDTIPDSLQSCLIGCTQLEGTWILNPAAIVQAAVQAT